jgi:hypothetical protein
LGYAAQHCDGLARYHELPQVQRITSNKLSRASIYRTGSAISPMTPNLNGQHVKCKCVLTSFREPVP